MTEPIVAIIGRANVGKSTLFNRLIGRKKAIVHDRPGVTRDRRGGNGSLFDLQFRLIDTAGLEESGPLSEAMWQQTERAIAEADVLLYMIDSRSGVTPQDLKLSAFLRKKDKPLILLANKSEGGAKYEGMAEAYRLAVGDPLPMSAEHGLGMDELYNALRKYIEPSAKKKSRRQEMKEATSEEAEDIIQIAIVGRPNVGKSTLVNHLLKDERMLTGPEAGVTRDSIAVNWEYNGRKLRLVDTAGLRKRARIEDDVEKLAAADTKRSAFLAQVVVLVLDADAVLEKQDLTIASQVIEEGRALIIAVNKWDTVKDKKESLERLKDKLQTSLRQVRGIPYVTISAIQEKGLDALMKTVFAVYDKWNKRVSTSPLNRWLQDAIERHPTPMAQNGRRIPMKYITQHKTRPPSFVIFSSNPDKLPESYYRYLVNGIRDNFDLDGVPIRLTVRKQKNPYADND